MQKEEIDLTNKTKLQKYLYYFDKYTSRNQSDPFLAFIWILFIGFLTSILEFEFINTSQNYIIYLTKGLFKEVFISLFVVLLVWAWIINLVFMRRDICYYVVIYTCCCLYLFATHDISFSLFLHNLNPFEIFIDGFGFYMIVQLLLKLIMVYLIYKMFLSIKNRKIF